MNGRGVKIDLLHYINNFMSTLIWIIIAVAVAAGIYWLMDWQSHHEDGE